MSTREPRKRSSSHRRVKRPAEEVGYGRPPRAHQFKPGQSGNPRGRPKGAKNEATLLRAILGRKLTAREGGKPRTMTVLEAIVLRFTEDALKGDYALRGIEAEASSKWDRGELRSFKSNLDHQNFWPDQFETRGHSYTAEKMKEARREHARKKPTRTKSAIDKEPAFPGGSGERRRKGQSPEEAIKRIADRYIRDSDGKK